MTNAINVYAASINERHAFEATRTMSESNLKKLQKAARTVSTDAANAMLVAANVDADFANASVIENKRVDVYALEKLSNFVFCAQFYSNNMNDMNYYILRTLINCDDAQVMMTLKDAQDACSAHRKTTNQLVVQNVEHKTDSTVTAQHRSTIAALVMLNILEKTYNEKREVCFKLNNDNAIYVALREQLEANA